MKSANQAKFRTLFMSSGSRAALFATLLCAGLAWTPSVSAQEVLLNGFPIAGSPSVVNQVTMPDGTVLTVDPGASIIVAADDAVIDLVNGTTITINNDGTIQATGATFDGINAAGSTLLLANSGNIAGQDRGVNAGTIANFTNTGSVTGAGGSAVNAITITNLVNSGTISSLGGFGVNGSTITNLVNSGTISSTANHGVNGGTISSLNNSGTISSTTDHGVNAITITNLNNSGTISSTGDHAVAGININSLINSGTISTTVNNGVSGSVITSLINSGVIRGGFTGVNVGTLSSLINSGTIEGSAGGAGVDMNFGTIVNSGLIQAGTGIDVDRGVAGDASITNTGTIRSLAGPAGTALEFQGVGADTLNVSGSFIIEGAINWDGIDDTLNYGPGRSSVLTVSNLPASISTSGQPFAVSGTTVAVVDPTGFALADDILADTTGAISDVLADKFGDNASGAVSLALSNGAQARVTPAAGGGTVSRSWAEVFGGWRGRDADRATLDSDHVFGGIVAGVDTLTGDGTRVGLFVGGAQSDLDITFNAQDIEIGSIFGGLYASREAGRARIDAAVTVGLSNHDTRRSIANNQVAGGVETAKSDHDAVFVSPEITVSTAVAGALGGAMTLKPSLRLRYAGLFQEGYSETGSSSNLTVDNRDVHILDARTQIAVPMSLKSDEHGMLSTELRAGVDARTSLGSDRVDAVLIGQNISFDPGGEDNVLSAFAAAAFAMAFTNALSITGSLEGGYGTDDTARATARLGARVDF